jgi:hypothetical protein
MARPSVFPAWATLDENDPISGLPNKVEPTVQWKDSGQKDGEFVPRSFLNYQFDLINDWAVYLDEQATLLNAAQPNVGKVTVITAASPTLTRDQVNFYIIMTGTVITLENVISVGGSTEQIGSVVKVRTTNSTTVTLNAGATRVGFTGTIPANRIATFTIESLPSGTGTEWSCEISAGV